jgi:hypothetical protein
VIRIRLKGDKGFSERVRLKPEGGELQILDNVRPQGPARPNRINSEALAQRFGHDRTADDRASLKDQDLFAFLREVRRGHKPIVPRADDDHIVMIFRHG